jgi:asparagine synthase (glutamine-hydrolysing)
VVAHLAEELRPLDLAAQLDGAFALAVWDTRSGEMTLVRDRVGHKPLYYATAGEAFVFGSEIKAVLVHPAVTRELDPAAIPAYLRFGYVPTPRTFYRGVVSLEPGHVLTVRPGQPAHVDSYSAVIRRQAQRGDSENVGEAVRTMRRRLEIGVRKRMSADAPVGALLSGGLHSSLVVALMARASNRPVQTFAVKLEGESGSDDGRLARLVARRYATNHHEYAVAPRPVDLLERLVWLHDQPFGDSSAIPRYLLAQASRAGATVALTGDGGGDLFVGLDRLGPAMVAARYQRLNPNLTRAVAQLAQRLPHGAVRRQIEEAQHAVAPSGHHPAVGAYLAGLGYFNDPAEMEAASRDSDPALEDFMRHWESTAGQSLVDRLLLLGFSTHVVDNLLVQVDRMSLVHGLAIRAPFLDPDLLTLVLGVRPSLKLSGWSGTGLLNRMAADLLPARVIHQRRRKLQVPVDRWFRRELAPYASTTLGSPDGRVRAYLRPGAVDRLIHEHAVGAGEHGRALWLLLMLEVFLRREGW